MKSPKCHYSVFPLLQNTGCRMQMVEFYFQLLLVSKQSATTEHFKNSGPICRHKDFTEDSAGRAEDQYSLCRPNQIPMLLPALPARPVLLQSR